jgi:hypothetical protein
VRLQAWLMSAVPRRRASRAATLLAKNAHACAPCPEPDGGGLTIHALSGIDKPIGVAEYQLLRNLPEPLTKSLPSIAQIEAELGGDMADEGSSCSA